MQMMSSPSASFLPSLLHQQFLARSGLLPPGAVLPPPHHAAANPAVTPPSSEDNMSPPPPSAADYTKEDEKQSTYDQTRARDFKCPLCSEQMTSLKEFTAHLRGHNELKPTNDPADPTGQTKVYNCCLCGKMLSSFSSLDRHMLVHSGERPFSCEVCGQTFTTNGNMHRHRRTHNDRASVESDGSAGSGGKRSRKRKAANLSSLAEAAEAVQKNKLINSAAASSESPLFRQQLSCPICPERFANELSLEVHVISLHPGRDIKCEDCGHPCPNYNYFKLHRSMFHNKLAPLPVIPPAVTAPTAVAATMAPSLPAFPVSAGGLPTPYTGSLQLLMNQQELISPAAAAPATRLLPNLFSPATPVAHATIKEEESLSDAHNTSFSSEVLQDDDPVLKEMKLKGEFPCRLCPAVYPNLRALKGHNKEHLISPPFQCNVGNCSYTNADKANLIQHMRGHTGQKPFECKICNFGFTTKANCERHVKNKHHKANRDDLRDHIIIHEHEDDSNAAGNAADAVRPVSASFEQETPLHHVFPPTPPRNSAFIPYRPFEVVDRDIVESDEGEIDGEAPLDLSKAASKTASAEDKTDSLIKPAFRDLIAGDKLDPPAVGGGLPLGYPGFPFNLPFLHQTPPSISPAGAPPPGLWPPAFGPAATSAGFPFNAMHLAALLASAKNEELKKQQSVVEGVTDLAGSLLAPSHPHHHHLLSQISPTNSSLSTHSPQSSPCKPPSSAASAALASNSGGPLESDSTYKMIIKNGVLMRKQKQRRYRTERPYGCEQCKARFTLRSNMDRHMKQQHPEAYYQKPRPGPGRKPAVQGNEEAVAAATTPMQQHQQLLPGQIFVKKDLMEQTRMVANEMAKNYETDEEDEEGFMEEDDDMEVEEEEKNLVIDDNIKKQHHQTFKNISHFFDGQKEGKAEMEDGDEGNKMSTAADEASSESSLTTEEKKLSAYSAAPQRLSCPYCTRKFPWASSLERHILTHTGQKPYKCTVCPLWFTTKSNCDRHIVRKHGAAAGDNANLADVEDDEEEEEEEGFHLPPGMDKLRRDSTGSESPYKCHICDDGFADRSMALGHLQTGHPEEYASLAAKGAFDLSEEPNTTPPSSHHSESGGEELYDALRGKFPDYANRKIICLFCSRKFWSAEDLRRHVRTHTGERPYSCDICARRFTLKHSMLRHRKKHDSGAGGASSSGVSSNSGEEASDDDLSVASMHSAEEMTTGCNAAGAGGGGQLQQAPTGEVYDKKRANLMEKISRLNSSTDCH